MDSDINATVELHYSRSLLRSVVDRWWIRTVGPVLGIGLAAFGTPLIYGLVHGDHSWVVGALGATLLVIVFGAKQIRAAHLRYSIERLRRLDDDKILLSISKDGLEFRGSKGSSLVGWKDLKEIRLSKDYWLLLRAPNDFSTLPLTTISPDLQNFMLDRFRNAGVRVRPA